MSLNELGTEFGPDIKRIADELTNSLPMSKPKLRTLSDDELKELHKMIKEVNAATSENQKVAKLQQHAKAAFDLLKILGVAL